jgi:hypothetical protein
MGVTTTLSSYLAVANNLGKWQAITQKSPDVSTQVKYFTENVGKIKSADDLIKNTRVFNFAMTAFGLGEMTYAKGLMRQVLHQGVADKDALANKINNPNIRAFAKAFDFAANGANTTSSPALRAEVVNRYIEQSLETKQGEQNPGVQLALYFRRNAPHVTSVYGLLADKNLLKVVQTALGISPMTSAQPIDAQARLLSRKVKLADFQDTKKLEAFISRFAAMYDSINRVGGAGPSNAANAILFDAPSSTAMDADLLLNLQSLKR